jgi:hypothetical protein
VDTQTDTRPKFPALNEMLLGTLTNVAHPSEPTGEMHLYFDNPNLRDLWIAVGWGG